VSDRSGKGLLFFFLSFFLFFFSLFPPFPFLSLHLRFPYFAFLFLFLSKIRGSQFQYSSSRQNKIPPIFSMLLYYQKKTRKKNTHTDSQLDAIGIHDIAFHTHTCGGEEQPYNNSP
jgi:hypothetical protein